MWFTISDSLTVYTVLCMICLYVSPGYCHMKRREQIYHISHSCRPVCSAGQTCVVYRTLSRVAVTRCVRINIHQYRLEGTQLVLKTHPQTRVQPRQPPAHTPQRPNYLTLQRSSIIQSLQQNGRIPTQPTIVRQHQHQTRIDIPQPVRTQPDRSSHVAGITRLGETVPHFARPHKDTNALREKMKRVFQKTGIRPDTNSRLVDFKLNGVPSRKVDVMLPINNIVDTADKGVMPPPSDVQINRIDPSVGNPTPIVSVPQDETCQSCAETTTCPDGQYCYHSTQCGIMICQPLS